ncbi:MAG: hypothetical protein ACI4F8_10805 [Lachnospiraceae bacterium]
MKKKLTLIVVLTLVVSTLLMACGSKKTLEDIVKAEDNYEQEIENVCNQIVASSNGQYRDADVDITGNTATYSFYFNDIGMTDDQIKTLLEQQDFSSVCDDFRDSFKNEEGVDADAIKIVVKFFSVTDSLIFSYTND